MLKIKIDPRRIDDRKINFIAEALLKRKVIVCPTDTVNGLSCLANDPKAIDKIYKIKRRKKNKPFLILVSSINMAKKYCYIDEKKNKKLKKIWRGGQTPVSVVLKSRGYLPKILEKDGAMAVRLPQNDFLIRLIKKTRVPLVSTSANKSGDKRQKIANGAAKEYFGKFCPEIFISAGKSKNNRPSKIVDLRDIKNIIAIRD